MKFGCYKLILTNIYRHVVMHNVFYELHIDRDLLFLVIFFLEIKIYCEIIFLAMSLMN